MGIKFSPVGLFTTEIKKIVESPTKYYLTPDEVGVLNGVLTEFEVLHHTAEFAPDDRLIGPNVDIRIDQEFVESSRDPLRTAELYNQVHGVLGSRFVDTNTYIRLGRAIEELGIRDNVSADILIAAREAGSLKDGELAGYARFSPTPLRYSGVFNPNATIRIVREREARGGRIERDDYNDYE